MPCRRHRGSSAISSWIWRKPLFNLVILEGASPSNWGGSFLQHFPFLFLAPSFFFYFSFGSFFFFSCSLLLQTSFFLHLALFFTSCLLLASLFLTFVHKRIAPLDLRAAFYAPRPVTPHQSDTSMRSPFTNGSASREVGAEPGVGGIPPIP